MAAAMISPLQKALWSLIFVCGSTSIALAQFSFVEVASTPYDRQMERIQPILTAAPASAIYGPSVSAVNQWIIGLRAMPYRYSSEWRTPFEVEIAKVGDCKGKALLLYDWMQANGATNVRLVIGKRRAEDTLTHAWLEWQSKIGTLLLDPTFNWNASFKLRNRRTYIAFYEYEGCHKYQATDSAVVSRTIGRRAPAAPAHGVVTQPMRTVSRTRSTSSFLEAAPIVPAYLRCRRGL
jgi:hypothetical protein